LKAKDIALAVAAIGLVFSIYLSIVHYLPTTLACPDKGIINCASVLTSQYAELFHVIPIAFLGVVFFVAEIMVIRMYFGKDEMILWNGMGLAFVFYFMFTEYAVGAICIYCTCVHICVITLLALSILYHGKATS